MASKAWLLAVVAGLLVAWADAGVTIETQKEGDGVNFPEVGKSIKVSVRMYVSLCFSMWILLLPAPPHPTVFQQRRPQVDADTNCFVEA